MVPFENKNVEKVFEHYEEPYRSKLLEMRELIFTTASKITIVGKIDESLKWGEPTYSTLETKSGSPIRMNKFENDKVAFFFHCQTKLIEQFKFLFYDELTFSKKRAIVLDSTKSLPKEALAICIEKALTYHYRAKK